MASENFLHFLRIFFVLSQLKNALADLVHSNSIGKLLEQPRSKLEEKFGNTSVASCES